MFDFVFVIKSFFIERISLIFRGYILGLTQQNNYYFPPNSKIMVLIML